jgi:tetratricopeptide (TPR) repeat protein
VDLLADSPEGDRRLHQTILIGKDDRMARRNGFFNWTLAIVLVLAVLVFASATFLVHSLRRGKRMARAEQALPVGEQAYVQKDWDKAADYLGLYLTTHGDDTAVLLKYADAQLKRRPVTPGDINHAISAYRNVLRLDTGNKEAARRLVEICRTRVGPAEAEAIALKFLESNNDDPTVRRMRAVCLAQQQKYPEAAMVLRQLIEDHPDDVPAYEAMGRLAEQRPADANKPAPEWFDQAIAANPQSAMAYIIRGAFHRLHGRRDQAIADFEQAEKLDLSDKDVHLRLVQELIRIQAFDKARTHLTALQTTMSDEIGLWQCWAAVALQSNSAEEQAKTAETGLKQLAAYPWDFLPMAVELFVAAGRQDRAQDCISQMQQRGLQPGAMITFMQGLAANGKGETWNAVSCWQDVLGQGYKLHSYAGGLGAIVPVRMMIASSLMQLGDSQSAIMQLRTLISELPNYRDLTDQGRAAMTVQGRVTLARLLVQARDWTGALDQVDEVKRIAPNLAEVSLIELQARALQLTEADPSSAGRDEAWQDVEKRLAKLDQDTGGAVQVKLLRAQAAIRRGEPAQAIEVLDQIQNKDPSNVQASLVKAEALVAQEKPEEAVALLRKTIEQSPQAADPARALALLLNQQKDPNGCESVLKEAMARMTLPGAKRDLGLLLADLYQYWARDDDLYRWLTDLAGQFPNDVQIRRRLLTCPAVAKDTRQAQTLVDQIKDIIKNTDGEPGWQWRYEQAKVWLNSEGFKDRYTQIVTSLQANLTANPDDQASRLLLAAAHEKAGQPQLALSLYREATRRPPGDIRMLMQTVAGLYRTGGSAEYDEANGYLQQAMNRQLYDPDLEKLELYGQRLRWHDQIRRGDLGSASETLQQILKQDPNDVSASLWLALVSMRQGRLDEAEAILKELRTQAPDSLAVIQAQVRLFILQKNVQEALQLCNETVQKQDRAAAYMLRAWTYAGIRENDKALEDFNQAVAKDPNNGDIRADRASFYASIGRRDKAIQDIRKALGLAEKSPALLDRVVPLCLTSGSRSLSRDAEAVLDAARKTDPNDPRLKLLKAQFLWSRGTRPAIEQSHVLLREVTAARPKLSQAWLLMGRLELGQGQVREALDTALGGLSYSERDKPLLLLKADAEAARSPALAVATLKLLAQDYPDDLEVILRLANALYRSGDKSGGQALIEARMKADPNKPDPVVAWIGLLASDQLWTDVTEQVKSWLRQHPDDTTMVSIVARTLAASGDPEGLKTAESLLSAALEQHPKSVQALSSFALLMQTMDRTAEAAMYNRKVLELDPNDAIALNNLAWSLCEDSGRCQEALDLAERGLKIAPDYLDLIDTRGVAHYRLGHLDQAAADFSKCIELYPANARSLAACYLHAGRAYLRMGRKTQAEEHLKRAMELNDQAASLSSKDVAELKLLLDQLQKGR